MTRAARFAFALMSGRRARPDTGTWDVMHRVAIGNLTAHTDLKIAGCGD